MSGGVENVTVQNCVFKDSFSIGSIKAVRGRGGYIRNVRYENCSMNNENYEVKACKWFRGAIYMDGFYGLDAFDVNEVLSMDETTPIVEDIIFKNIILKTVEGYGIYICGLPESPLRNVTLKNVVVDGPLGFYHVNIDNLQMKHVQVNKCKESI